jgi:predicted alpha/beta-hydrolase family hydrolase
MRRLAEELGTSGVATFRYNYPYSERGKGGMDPENVRLATVRAATETAGRSTPDLPLFAGGHSMSGRMTTLAVAHGIVCGLVGVVALAFPLHSSGKPSMSRADHLGNVSTPILFISGTRDRMANLNLLHQVVNERTSSTRLHVLEGADHGFNGLQRSGPSRDEILAELVRTTADWTASPTTR